MMISWKEAEARAAAGGTITRQELKEIIARGSSRTADEFDRLLHACPEWVAEHEEREAKRRALEVQYHAEEELMLADLRRVGYRLTSVYDFVNSADSYPEAIPVLLDHLRRPYSNRIKEGIARALSVREARGIAGPVMVDVLRQSNDNDLSCRWALANALTIVADRSVREDIKALIANETSDDVRNRLTRALKTAAKP